MSDIIDRARGSKWPESAIRCDNCDEMAFINLEGNWTCLACGHVEIDEAVCCEPWTQPDGRCARDFCPEADNGWEDKW